MTAAIVGGILGAAVPWAFPRAFTRLREASWPVVIAGAVPLWVGAGWIVWATR